MAKSTKPSAPSSSTSSRAVHRHFSDTIVTFKVGADFLGKKQYRVRFKNGEIATMGESWFNEQFEIL